VAEKLKLEIVSPDKMVLSDEVDEVVATGSLGQFGVLPGHLAFLATLDVGELSYRKGGSTYYAFVNSGYAEVSSDKVTILAESAEKAEYIDLQRAEEAKKRAEDRLSRATTGSETIDEKRAEVSLKRSLIRLQVGAKAPTR